MNDNNPIRFGECCDKCGRPRMSCICIRRIGMIGSGETGAELAKLLLQRKYTKDEVIKLCRDYAHNEACDDNWDEDKWIKENLK